MLFISQYKGRQDYLIREHYNCFSFLLCSFPFSLGGRGEGAGNLWLMRRWGVLTQDIAFYKEL